MAYFTTTIDFTNGQQVTSANLDEITIGMRLADQSVDGQTITLNSGVLSLGTITEDNYGGLSIPRAALQNDIIDGTKIADLAVGEEHLEDDSVIERTIADSSINWAHLKSADKATQANMQSEAIGKFVSAAMVKYSPGVAKAYGIVQMTDGIVTVTGGYNVTSATEDGANRVITLTNAMANTNYVVGLSYGAAAAVGASIAIDNTSKTTTTFKILGAETAGREIHFWVFGQLAPPPP